MLSISNNFKKALKTNGKLIDAIITEKSNIYTKPNIVSIDYSYKADLFKSFMKQADIELLGNDYLKGKELFVQFGVKQNPSDTYEHISLGNFIAKEQEEVLNTKSIKLECYDLMLYSMVPYDLHLDISEDNPITIGDYLQKICTRLGWILADTTFINSDKLLIEEKYDSTYTFRDVLDEIAQCSLSLIGFLNDNQLHVIYPTETNEIIDFNLRKFTVNEKYGKVNSLVLARTPQEDNIYRQDADSIAENGLTEIKIENNQLMDKDRDTFIDDAFNYINGFEYNPFQFESFGICYLEIGDRFTVVDPLTRISYNTILLSDNLQITQGLNEVASANIPRTTTTDYNKADTTERRINKTILQVDKQEQVITALISGQNEQGGQLAQMVGDLNGFKFDVQASGGINSLRNSVGLNDTEFWETTGNVYTLQNEYLKQNTISESAIVCANGKASQTINTLVGTEYNLTFKYSQTIANCYVNIISNNTFPVLQSNTPASLKEVSFNFIALSEQTTIEFGSDDNNLTITDLIIGLGNLTLQWQPNANEIYGSGVAIDIKGIKITSLTDRLRMLLNSQKIEISNLANNTVMALFTKDGAMTHDLLVNNLLTVTKYNTKSGINEDGNPYKMSWLND